MFPGDSSFRGKYQKMITLEATKTAHYNIFKSIYLGATRPKISYCCLGAKKYDTSLENHEKMIRVKYRSIILSQRNWRA